MKLSNLGQVLLRSIWPQICVHCRQLVEEAWAPLCRSCRLTLTHCEPPYCQRCADPAAGARAYCPRCESGVPACRLIRAACFYRGGAVSLVHSFKYRGRHAAARLGGALMAQALPLHPELGRPDALVPVPLHPRRERLRGYNQAAVIARTLSEITRIPSYPALLRPSRTRPQWRLNRRERLENLTQAIRAKEDSSLAGKRLLLIDDVCTSGASLEACARALRQAGARVVDGFVFARQAAI